jgi:gliding motility-associated-like protein
MRRFLQIRSLYITALLFLSGSFIRAFAQAPNISYPTPQNFPVNKTITPITPQNKGGMVPANAYGQVTTFAGGRAPVTFDGTGTNAGFNLPSGIAVDAAGTVYVSDFGSGAIRKITPAAVVTTINNVSSPAGLTLDMQNNLFITDFQGNYVYKISAGGTNSIYAGDGTSGAVNGSAAASSFNNPGGIIVDVSGNVFVADQQNNMIRQITPAGIVRTYAGSGSAGVNNGVGTGASFNNPDGLALDGQGNLYVADTKNNLIRIIGPGEVVTTLAGSGVPGQADGTGASASFNYPTSLAFDALANLYVADYKNNLIRKLTLSGVVTTLAGDGTAGQTNAVGKLASFNGPIGLATDANGYLYVTDEINYMVRKIALTGYSIDKTLPPGLIFDPTTGTISGTPTALSPPTDYIITAYNVAGSSSTTVSIAVTGITPVITTSTITGNIIGCVGSPGESPNVGKFTVAGTSLSGDITVTPPPGFDLSLTAIGGYSTSLTLKQIGGTVINRDIYIRSSAADPVGPISGNIQLTTPGATADVVPVTGVVNALPKVDPVQNVSYDSGATTTPINFTGTGNTFTWTNDNPTIGLPASGSGPIPAFQTTNTGSSPVIATITVTPTKPGLVYITQGSNIVVINSATNSFFKIPLTNAGPYGVAASSDGNRIYMSDPNSNSVYGINTTTNVIELTIHTIDGPRGLAVSPDGNHIYITDEFTNQIAVASTVTGAVIATIPVGISPLGVAVSPDGGLVYVANQGSKTVSVINTSTNKVTATIPVTIQPNDVVVSPDGSLIYISGSGPGSALIIDAGSNTVLKSVATGPNSVGESLSPDGNRLYVVNEDGNSVSVIDTKTQAVIATIPVGGSPQSISVTSNGNLAYVVGQDGNIYIIDTSTNLVINTLSVGIGSLSFGSFITPGTSCPGTPITFTITVNSLSPSITAGPVSGSISACLGSASAGVNIQQFTVSGSNLTGDITATAPSGFEISSAQGNGFGGVVTIPQSAGIVSNVTVYVRSAAADPSGSISGNVVLSSPGATSQNVPVSGTVNALPTANAVTNQTKNNGGPTDPINFTGTGGDTYNWTNDVPGIGLPASGTGNIPSFNTIDVNGDTPVTATLTVTPLNTVTGCTGAPVTFTITVNPASPPVITSSGTLTGLNTIYGAASSSETFTVSATNLTEGILVTAPQGFEVSADNQTFSNTITAGQAGNITNVPVYIRLAATTPAGNYFGNIVLSTIGASDVNVSIPISVVNRAILTVTAPDVTRAYGTPNPVFIPQYQGFVNGDNESGLTVLPELTTVATTTSPEGKYAIHVTGGSSHNYIINPVDGTLTIIASESEIIIPNAFTPNGDGINDLWTIQKLSDFPQCLVSVYTRYGNLVYQSRGYVKPWDGTVNGSPVPTGTYYYVINPNVSGFGLLSGYVAVLR